MIIGFTGLMQSGKTTASDKLIEQRFTKINFKDALVEELKTKFPDLLDLLVFDNGGDPRVEDIDDLFEYKPPLMRALMQNFGTEVRRGDDPNYWVKQWVTKIKACKTNIVVDDVRFLNEAHAIKANGGYIIRIQRSDITQIASHQSETEMARISADCAISVGKGEFQALHEQINTFINEKSQS